MKTLATSKLVILYLGALLTFQAHDLGQSKPAGSTAPAAKAADPWAPCRFLLGDWVGVEGSGQPGQPISGGGWP